MWQSNGLNHVNIIFYIITEEPIVPAYPTEPFFMIFRNHLWLKSFFCLECGQSVRSSRIVRGEIFLIMWTRAWSSCFDDRQWHNTWRLSMGGRYPVPWQTLLRRISHFQVFNSVNKNFTFWSIFDNHAELFDINLADDTLHLVSTLNASCFTSVGHMFQSLRVQTIWFLTILFSATSSSLQPTA